MQKRKDNINLICILPGSLQVHKNHCPRRQPGSSEKEAGKTNSRQVLVYQFALENSIGAQGFIYNRDERKEERYGVKFRRDRQKV